MPSPPPSSLHECTARPLPAQELECYRPAPHRAYLAALRAAMYYGSDAVGPGGAETLPPAAAGGSDAAAQAPIDSEAPASQPTTAAAAAAAPRATHQQLAPPPPQPPPHHHHHHHHHRHRLRDLVVAGGDAELAGLFNACVGLVWAFRDIHLCFAELYIGRFTSREAATGGTPYRAYLRKHRDESGLGGQLPGGALCTWLPSPPPEQLQRELDAVLRDDATQGIPGYLRARHAELLARLGGGDASLQRKAFVVNDE